MKRTPKKTSKPIPVDYVEELPTQHDVDLAMSALNACDVLLPILGSLVRDARRSGETDGLQFVLRLRSDLSAFRSSMVDLMSHSQIDTDKYPNGDLPDELKGRLHDDDEEFVRVFEDILKFH